MRNILRGLKNKNIRFISFVFVILSLISLVDLSQKAYAMETRKNAAGLVDGLNYQKSDCESVGLSYDPNGSGKLGYGCIFERNLESVGSGVYRVKSSGGELIESSPSRIYSQVDNYLSKDGMQCIVGYTLRKVKIRSSSIQGGDPQVSSGSNPNPGKLVTTDIDAVLCVKSGAKSFVGYPPSYNGKEEMTKDKCKSFGMNWEKGVGGKYWCTYLNNKEAKAVRAVASPPDEYLIDKGRKCPSGWKQDIYTIIRNNNTTNNGYTYTNTTTKTEMVHCTKEGANPQLGTQTGNPGSGANQSADGATKCGIDQLGWIVCPTTNFLTEAVVSTYQYIATNFLSIQSDGLFGETESGQNVKKAWDGFRDVANIVFAILFVIVVLSQITNIGISNYGIKKLLPRLLIFAILINISYWVSVIFVDLSNIMGKWTFNFLAEGGSDGHISNLSGTIQTILAGGAAAASVGMAGGIFLSVVAALVAILLMVAILTIRQAAVVILVVLSPLAFAAAILPGTESLFSKWKNTLKSMLIIFPVCSLIMGGMLMASRILVGTADGNPILEALYTLLPLIGLGSVFVAIKGALAAIDKLTGGSITGKLSSMASGLNKAAEKSPIGSLDKGINSRIAAKYQQFGGKLSRRANRFAKAGEESRARAMRDAQISDYEKMGSLNSGQELHLSKLRSEKQKEADLLTSSRSLALSNEIGSKSGEYIAKAEAALNRQDGEELGVILDSIMTNPRLSGKDRMAKISEIISKMSAEQTSSGAVQKAMATFAGKHGGNIKKDDPALLKTIGSLADGAEQSGAEIYQEHASNVETYKDASQSDAAGWNPQALANIEKYKSGWSAHDAEVIGAKSAAVLGDERLRHSISEAQRELHQKIATDAGLKISHDNDTNNAQADIAQALKDLNSTIQQQSQQPTQQRQAPQPRGPRRWR